MPRNYPADVDGRLLIVGDIVEYPLHTGVFRTVMELRGVSGCVVRLEPAAGEYHWYGPGLMRIWQG